MSVISVRNLGKQFHLGGLAHNTLRDQIAGWFQRGAREKTDESFWALRDVSFDVQPGEVVGVIGRNGAGKSTLLKILSQITEPTEGEVRIRGRVASLLEVGTGFHPELSGRENIFLNGAILGMTRREIRGKFDEIVAFAEVEKFIDTPVKHYSSGMYVRLAFAVAAHLEPEILIIDEVLAVGDGAFQKKCLGKMGDVSRSGRTVLFVSHSMAAMQILCRRCIRLQDGRLVDQGPSEEVIAAYLQTETRPVIEQVWSTPESAPGSEAVRLHRAAVRSTAADPRAPLGIGTPFAIEIEYWNHEPGAHLHLGLHLFDALGVNVFCTNTAREPAWHGRPQPAGLFRSVCRIPAHLLNDGTYRLKLLVVKDKNRVLSTHDDLLVFDLADDDVEIRSGWFGKWPGVVRPKLEWTTEHLDSAASGVGPALANAFPPTQSAA